MLRVGVLFGGRSGEHDVSLCSAASIISALNPEKYDVTAIGIDRDGRWYVQDRPVIVENDDFGRVMKLEKKGRWFLNHFERNSKLILNNIESEKFIEIDVVIPAVHGSYCEDGSLQGLLELAMVPYVGADTIGSSIAIDKDVAKRLLRDGGITVVPWRTVLKIEWDRDSDAIIGEVSKSLSFPLFVKPARTGSSVGIKKVKEKDGLGDACEFAFSYDNKILIEKGVSAREIECAVLGNSEPQASVLGEVIPKHEFYSYESKYIDSDGAELYIPANIDRNVSELIRKTAIDAYRILNCSGMARVDFFLDKAGRAYYLNEINTLPGFTSISMYPKLWEYSGIDYSSLIDKLIELALERHRMKMSIRTEI